MLAMLCSPVLFAMQGVINGLDGELDALRERLTEAKAVSRSQAEELAEAKQLVAEGCAPPSSAAKLLFWLWPLPG